MFRYRQGLEIFRKSVFKNTGPVFSSLEVIHEEPEVRVEMKYCQTF